MNIKLSDIFTPHPHKYYYSKRELLTLEMKSDFIDEVGKRMDLTYSENEEKEGNLCFMNSGQLRPEYRSFFSKLDVIEYLGFALETQEFDISTNEVPFPEAGTFLNRIY